MKLAHAVALGALLAGSSLLTSCSDGRMPTAGPPHPLGLTWILPEAAAAQNAQFHGAALDDFNCATCHELDTFCSRCHFGPTGTRTPNAAVWTHGFALHWEYQEFGDTCGQCHVLHNVALGFTLKRCATGICHANPDGT